LNTFKSFEAQLYKVNANSFDDIALALFRHQAQHNAVYQKYINSLGLSIDKIHTVRDIPFLPISFFKTQTIKTGAWEAETIFSSSGTTGSTTSAHLIANLQFYLDHAVRCFEYFFGDIRDYHFLALLPSYLERTNSSLVAMMDYFIKRSESSHSGFYLSDTEKLLNDLFLLKNDTKKVILWGVSFALLDLAEKFQPDLRHCTIFETGGMKGRRKEIIREELHNALRNGLNADKIYSEYGMTELLSQSYSKGESLFFSPPWTKTIGRDITDPFAIGLQNQTCGINVIDLANWHSICFIETEDIGKCYENGTFEVLGRMDNSEIRGCNLMVE
jgi:phenylacetate-coenzyme A ligase PaaK-like adenylate-forming protein